MNIAYTLVQCHFCKQIAGKEEINFYTSVYVQNGTPGPSTAYPFSVSCLRLACHLSFDNEGEEALFQPAWLIRRPTHHLHQRDEGAPELAAALTVLIAPWTNMDMSTMFSCHMQRRIVMTFWNNTRRARHHTWLWAFGSARVKPQV